MNQRLLSPMAVRLLRLPIYVRDWVISNNWANIVPGISFLGLNWINCTCCGYNIRDNEKFKASDIEVHH